MNASEAGIVSGAGSNVSVVVGVGNWTPNLSGVHVGGESMNSEQVMGFVNEVNRLLDSGRPADCERLALLGRTDLRDGCYLKIAHDERNASKCGVLWDNEVRGYCVTRIGELREMEGLS